MYICPVCNGLVSYNKYCDKCGTKMEILDRVEDYDDSYSECLDFEITDLNDGDPFNICSHVLQCPNCKNTEVIGFKNIIK